MIKPRRKTLLAANVIVPGLIALAYNCPLWWGQSGHTGTGFDADWDVNTTNGTHNTWAMFIDTPARMAEAWDKHEDCSHNFITDDHQGPTKTTAMAAFGTWSTSDTAWALSRVEAGGWAAAWVGGNP